MERGAKVGSGAKGVKAPGVFETIAGAASTVLVRPLPLLVPLALDLWLWQGVRLSPAVVAAPLGRWIEESRAAVAEAQAGGAEATGVAWPEEIGVGLADLGDVAGAFVPTLLSFGDRSALPDVWSPPVVTPSAGAVAALVVVLVVVGVGGLMSMLALLVRVGRDEPIDGRLGRVIALATVRYLGFLAMAAAVCLAVAVPAAIGLGLLGLVAGPAASLLTLAIPPVVFVASLFLAFTGEAMVLAKAGPLRAPLLSARLVRQNFGPALGLLVVVSTFSLGLPLVAGGLVTTVPGLLAAALVAAFVATVLALAKLEFFAARAEGLGVRST